MQPLGRNPIPLRRLNIRMTRSYGRSCAMIGVIRYVSLNMFITPLAYTDSAEPQTIIPKVMTEWFIGGTDQQVAA